MMLVLRLFWGFMKVSLFAFGGGLSILPLLFETIRGFDVMSSSEFADLVAISQVTPGPMVVNAATYAGMVAAGIPGALMATLGVAIPSFAVVIIAMMFIEKFKESEGLNGVLSGIRPATCGMIAAGLFTLLESVVTAKKIISLAFLVNIAGSINCFPLILFIVTIILVGKLDMSPVLAIIIMGFLGIAKVYVAG